MDSSRSEWDVLAVRAQAAVGGTISSPVPVDAILLLLHLLLNYPLLLFQQQSSPAF